MFPVGVTNKCDLMISNCSDRPPASLSFPWQNRDFADPWNSQDDSQHVAAVDGTGPRAIVDSWHLSYLPWQQRIAALHLLARCNRCRPPPLSLTFPPSSGPLVVPPPAGAPLASTPSRSHSLHILQGSRAPHPVRSTIDDCSWPSYPLVCITMHGLHGVIDIT